MAENSLKIRTKVRMAQWQSIIKECKESGMTVAEFCEDRNISWHADGHHETLEQVGIDKEYGVPKLT
ncbi:hypothetical protein SAMN02745671_01269 [Anaerovibrio lipolyticus DSM 3074]|uniref:Uncharacterized protein n=1 Tax=Anaerovibrio lipolyticus DSM 3074 TaxID=1120997 RepID=A0A1M6CX42_9FIRM|nr:hypothetical protein [Anaerovibrio lipolyticus]SHI65645.1 hypothetical protein SAMN02745671_01269 [Anaerovibrio lipolyticus DSM 3074]